MTAPLHQLAVRMHSELKPAKLKNLVSQVPGCFAQVQTELLAFADFLERQASQ